jgi:hypothetical protein
MSRVGPVPSLAKGVVVCAFCSMQLLHPCLSGGMLGDDVPCNSAKLHARRDE